MTLVNGEWLSKYSISNKEFAIFGYPPPRESRYFAENYIANSVTKKSINPDAEHRGIL